MNILLLNGPNLNMLGQREPDKYGTQTLQDIVDDLQAQAASSDVTLSHFQSNAEHALIERIHDAMGNTDAIIINPAAFTHTSVAIRVIVGLGPMGYSLALTAAINLPKSQK